MTLVNGDLGELFKKDAQAFNQTLTNSERERKWWLSSVIAARESLVSGMTGHKLTLPAGDPGKLGVNCYTLLPKEMHFYIDECKNPFNFACQLYNPSYFLSP
jgi:hypothetical protein